MVELKYIFIILSIVIVIIIIALLCVHSKNKNNYDYNPKNIIEFHEKHPDNTALVEIDSKGNYNIHVKSLKNPEHFNKFQEMFSLLASRYKLPQCIFVQYFGDGHIDSDRLPIFKNSIPKDNSKNNPNGILSPYWYFLMGKEYIDQVINIPMINWSFKKNKAIWRGSSTGYSHNNFRENNKISRKYVVDKSEKYPDLIDGKFTNLTQHSGNILKTNKYDTVLKMIPKDQTRFKYIISMDGNGGTYGLYWTLASGSVCLKNSTFNQWFDMYFKADRDYLEFNDIEGKDNLKQVVEYLNENPKLARRIAMNAREKSKKIFDVNFVLRYMYTLLSSYSKHQSKFI